MIPAPRRIFVTKTRRDSSLWLEPRDPPRVERGGSHCSHETPEETLGTITEDMRRVVEEQRLGFAATVCPDGTPNLSPKGTTTVWDEDRLIFADIRSPRTVENLRRNPAIEVNVVDPISRKGYRFKGTAAVLTEGDRFDEAIRFYRERGSPTRSGPSCLWRWNVPCRSPPRPTTWARPRTRCGSGGSATGKQYAGARAEHRRVIDHVPKLSVKSGTNDHGKSITLRITL
jgi:uncharacterized protein